MLDRQWMLDFQKAREDEDRAWRSTEAAIAGRRHRNELILIGILVPIATAAVTVAAAFIERGDLFSSDNATPTPIIVNLPAAQDQMPARSGQ